MADTATATEPKTEIDQFYETNAEAPQESAPAEEAKGPAEAPAGQTTTPDFWGEIVNDDDLPPSLQGKTRKEVWDANKNALAQAHQAGYQKNESDARLRVAEATNAALLRQLQSFPQAPAQPAYKSLVQDPTEVYTAPERFANAIPQYVDQAVQRQVDEVRQNEVAPLRGDLLRMQGEMAREAARSEMKIERDVWDSVTPGVAAIMAANQWDPRNKQAWSQAATIYKQQAAKFYPAPVKTEVTSSPNGNAKPTPNVSPTAQKKAPSTGNKHIDKALQEQLTVWNATPGVKKMSLEDFQDMVSADLGAGGW